MGTVLTKTRPRTWGPIFCAIVGTFWAFLVWKVEPVRPVPWWVPVWLVKVVLGGSVSVFGVAWFVAERFHRELAYDDEGLRFVDRRSAVHVKYADIKELWWPEMSDNSTIRLRTTSRNYFIELGEFGIGNDAAIEALIVALWRSVSVERQHGWEKMRYRQWQRAAPVAEVFGPDALRLTAAMVNRTWLLAWIWMLGFLASVYLTIGFVYGDDFGDPEVMQIINRFLLIAGAIATVSIFLWWSLFRWQLSADDVFIHASSEMSGRTLNLVGAFCCGLLPAVAFVDWFTHQHPQLKPLTRWIAPAVLMALSWQVYRYLIRQGKVERSDRNLWAAEHPEWISPPNPEEKAPPP